MNLPFNGKNASHKAFYNTACIGGKHYRSFMKTMKRILAFFFCMMFLIFSVFGQNTSITNNNSITIQGNVYYFRPSTTPSSPPPTQTTDFLGSGHWYGEDAARAWASIADWVIDHCLDASSAIIGNNNERVYISAVHVIRENEIGFNNHKSDRIGNKIYSKQVRIDYWVVRNGTQMADGKRETRWFGF
jgi:hypothetical protein